MNTQDTVSKLRLMTDTIEELEIDNIIACEVDTSGKMNVHLRNVIITPADEIIWKERFCIAYPWEKSFNHNNVHFFSLRTEEEYKAEKNS